VLCEPTILPAGTPEPGTNLARDLKSALQATRHAVQPPQPAEGGPVPPESDVSTFFLPPANDDDKDELKALRWWADKPPQTKDSEAKMQRTLTFAADSKRFKQLLTTANPADRARLLSCSGPCAGAWLTALPTDSHTRLQSKVYRAAARLRLGLPIFDETSSKCVCGNTNADPKIDRHHALSCIKVRKNAVNFRHDMVKSVVHTWATRMGCPAIKEPKNLVKGQERADNLIVMPTTGDAFLCDVAIVQPSAPTHVNTGKHQLAVADAAAAAKRAQYTQMAVEEGAEFVPIIAEVFGALHEDGIKFFKQLANLAVEDAACPWNRLEALVAIKSSVAVAIQKGNFQAFARVQFSNRAAGLVSSRRRFLADEGAGAGEAADAGAAEQPAGVRADNHRDSDSKTGVASDERERPQHAAEGDRDEFGGEAVESSPFAGQQQQAVVRVPHDLDMAIDSGAASVDDVVLDVAASRRAAHSRQHVGAHV
jgi:hypothetical protein